ncbi:glutamine--fructose-6-phosphate transaminase (isomerizing) [Limosilactobacillus reuteri]|jgi:glucosamine--fructose-6-phosphate aminotransferase (isomerizing)|uniref:Glutamine--fructose-6-phosphate aminotransferase [isomerizing] n=2 Tax=Limosilactobacillus reuteri TaxID=1598 RepID=A0A0U5JE99_LIMRT|nr:glutamine--fructose-6-phosphate transaminase (isomerizing) [Limosilactobacillus reuteri]AGN99731.1 glutamine-fructose-6-phosphate transaminase [Limosilactobacillus reuteri I5007]MCC4345366.1 glutamine--fructose-6-phosphate transaminase (isomerizing) [Limosilactobacillus reuteri]MCC4390412.1 glutamine--fructose-6-phosphate transaminase (isomerizing) [Limosilactobacillus reuteri]MCC4390985.1 glutamine--fructose-6-phosphate transaminase (isomerizing) [Limosilactobacillus reuteri]MCC4427310.1 g
MCGIVGVTGTDKSLSILIDGLKRLEYRGYDSAGVYVNDQQGHDYLVKRPGRIANLEAALGEEVHGLAGIGHTRWATHGEPNEANAHPQYSQDERFYLVHNGVIENYADLKKEYLSDIKFVSQTDTEVIVQLVDKFVVESGMSTEAALLKVLRLISPDSSYAFVLMDKEQPDTLFVAKNKSPLLVGIADGYNMVGSDAMSMIKETNTFMEIGDHELVIVKPDHVTVKDFDGNEIDRPTFKVDMDANAADKGAYPYYMLKEIDEQPAVMRKLVQEYFGDNDVAQINEEMLKDMANADHLYIVGAGTSYHAGLVGARIFEKLCGIPTSVHISSEFAYEQPLLSKKPFFIFLSQSGETADSREVLVNVNKHNWPSLTITNVDKSTLSREATYTELLYAGPEIAVASTKAYTAQIAVEAILAQALGVYMDKQAAKDFDVKHQLGLVANGMQSITDSKKKVEEIASRYLSKSPSAFYIGRGMDWSVSLEAALKLKEISYVQAEGFASGELKHGTIALIEDQTPVIGIITQDRTAGLTRSNLEETQARGANAITIVSRHLAKEDDTFVLPDVDEILTPLLSVIPAQLLAYYTSLGKGLDVDKPRNLAKSVTVQ